MKLDIVRTITEARGPFATVYLEGRNPSEDAATQLRLRWDDLRGRLTESGADDEILAALDEVLTGDSPDRAQEIQADGRVLVANESGVLLNET